MKTKFLLIYGYFIPILASAVISSLPFFLPWLFWFISYDDIAVFISHNLAIIFTFLTMVGALAIPFQNTLISEDNPHVLSVLGEKTKVRKEFLRASKYQVGFIAFLAALVLIFSSLETQSGLLGYIELFILLLIVFESFALISNGIAYSQIREKIITEVSNAALKKDLKDQVLEKTNDPNCNKRTRQ